MSPKELTDIAHRFKEYARGNSGLPEQHMRALADHILDTVREDDDEALSVEWITAVSEPDILCDEQWRIGKLQYLTEKEKLFGWEVDYEELPYLLTPRTRGQLRTLCRLLGVTLAEGGAE